MGWADFCMDPDGNSLHVLAVDEGSAVQETAYYYIKCEGTNPLQEEIDDAYASVSLMEQAVHVLYDSGGACEGNADLHAVLNSTEEVYVVIDDITAVIDCSPVQREWGNLMHDGVCTDMFTGFHDIWQALYFSAFFLLSLCVTASLLYQFFHVTMDGAEDSDHDDFNEKQMRADQHPYRLTEASAGGIKEDDGVELTMEAVY